VPPPSPADDPWAPIKDWLLGGNTIVKVGVGILFVGLAFLAKYASQHVHVPIELRLAGIGAVAIVLLVIGWRLRLRRPGYAQVLQGGAVAVLYLTLFVAFKVYGVIAVGPVFALMIAVAGLAAALAVLQDAKSLAVVGALGGFAAPILVSTGSGNYVALFTYYLVLDLGIAAVAWHKAWRSLNLIGFFATFLIGTSWGLLKYQSENFAVSEGFLVAYFLLFVAILLMPVRRASAAAATDPALRPGLRGQPRDRHRFPHAGDSLRPRRAQHRRRLGARRCGSRLDRVPSVAAPGSRVRVSAPAPGRPFDDGRRGALRRPHDVLERRLLQRPHGGRRVPRRRVLRASGEGRRR
jgi:uncharacterized membrane protein